MSVKTISPGRDEICIPVRSVTKFWEGMKCRFTVGHPGEEIEN